MDNFRDNQMKLQEAFTGQHGRRMSAAKMAETNMAMFQAATRALMPGGKPRTALQTLFGRRSGRIARPDGRDAEEAGRIGRVKPSLVPDFGGPSTRNPVSTSLCPSG